MSDQRTGWPILKCRTNEPFLLVILGEWSFNGLWTVVSVSYRVSHSLHHCPCLTLFLTACTTVRVLPCLSQPAPLFPSYHVSHSQHHCLCLTLYLIVCTTIRVLPCLSQPAPLSLSNPVSHSLHQVVRVLITLSLTACTTVRVLPCLSQPAPLSVSYLVFQSLHHFSDSLVHGRHHATVGFA